MNPKALSALALFCLLSTPQSVDAANWLPWNWGKQEPESAIDRFQSQSEGMMSGNYGDVVTGEYVDQKSADKTDTQRSSWNPSTWFSSQEDEESTIKSFEDVITGTYVDKKPAKEAKVAPRSFSERFMRWWSNEDAIRAQEEEERRALEDIATGKAETDWEDRKNKRKEAFAQAQAKKEADQERHRQRVDMMRKELARKSAPTLVAEAPKKAPEPVTSTPEPEPETLEVPAAPAEETFTPMDTTEDTVGLQPTIQNEVPQPEITQPVEMQVPVNIPHAEVPQPVEMQAPITTAQPKAASKPAAAPQRTTKQSAKGKRGTKRKRSDSDSSDSEFDPNAPDIREDERINQKAKREKQARKEAKAKGEEPAKKKQKTQKS